MEDYQKIKWKLFEHWKSDDGDKAYIITMLFNGSLVSKFVKDSHHIHYRILQNVMGQIIEQMSMYHNRDITIGNITCGNMLISLNDGTIYMLGPYEKIHQSDEAGVYCQAIPDLGENRNAGATKKGDIRYLAAVLIELIFGERISDQDLQALIEGGRIPTEMQ